MIGKVPAKYPIRRISMSKVHITSGRKTVPTTPIFEGQIPRRVIVGFVKSDTYFGDYKKSPFHFAHSNVQEISIHAGGQVYPREPLKMDFSNNHYTRPYLFFFDALGLGEENKSNSIGYEEYKKAMCLFAFDLTPVHCDANNWELIKEGTTIVHCEFSESVPINLEMIIYAEFDNVCMIDHNRNVYFDYSV